MTAIGYAASPTDPDPLSIEISWRDLYEESQRSLLAPSVVLGWLIVLDCARQGQIVTGQLVAASLLMAGPLASLALLAPRPTLSRYALAGALAAAYLALAAAYPQGVVLYAGVLVLVACFGMLSTVEHLALTGILALGLVAVHALSTAPHPPWSLTATSLALLGGVAVCGWIARRPLFLALNWASQSTSRALDLNAALRRRQLELNRTLRAMDEANERLATMNRRLAEARQMADEARRAKSRFAASISHELRTPLNLIVGFTQVMYTTPEAYHDIQLSPAFMVDLGVVHRNAQHLQRLVDDVLDLTELELGRMAIQPEVIDMGALAREAMATMEGLARLRGLDLVAALGPVPPVYADRTRIKQVLLNLLTNAARYTERGSITVRLISSEGWVVCEVEDTGPGIRSEDQQRLFQEFERVTPEDRQNRGSGLGLAISKRFVQAHGGEIWVHSEEGVGSTFSFRLPEQRVFSTQALAERPGVPGGTSAPGERPPLVVLTHSLTAGRLFSRHVEQHRAVVAHDVATALHHAVSLQPSTLLVDAALDPAEREEVADALVAGALEEEPRALLSRPHLVVTPMPSDDAQRISPAVRGYLAKPIQREDLLAVLRAQGEAIQRVLLVDDDEDLLRLLKHYLEDASRPYQVVTARNGREALQCVTEHRIDLAFIDLVMPVMDGYRFLREIERRGIALPVVVISGQDALQPETRLRGEVSLYLAEPVSSERLVCALDGLAATLGAVNSRRGEGPASPARPAPEAVPPASPAF